MQDICLKGRLLTGESKIFYVNSDMTIARLKKAVMTSIKLDTEQITLVYGNNLLENS